MQLKLKDRIAGICIKIADWISHPIAIILFPITCIVYMVAGGVEGRLTLILSIWAISLTQMVLNAQNVDAQATKLQIAELVRANPKARNVVIKEDLTLEEMHELKEEIENAITGKIRMVEQCGSATKSNN